MITPIKRNIGGLFLIGLIFSVKIICACDYAGGVSLEKSIKESALIFSGTVIGSVFRKGIPNAAMEAAAQKSGKKIDYQTLVVNIRVNQWWKGNLPPEIQLVRNETMTADGIINSWGRDYQFSSGEDYLIFAAGKENEYRADCTRTRRLIYAKDDLKVLGKGRKYKTDSPPKTHRIWIKKEKIPVFKFQKLKPGMTAAQVEKKLGKPLDLKDEYDLPATDFKGAGIKTRKPMNASVRFYRNRLYAIGISYDKEQWGSIDELLAFLSKKLKLKIPWTDLIISDNLIMKRIDFPNYQITVMSNELSYEVSIWNEEIMNRLRERVKQRKIN